MKKAARVGDHGRGGRGLDDCAVVLVDRIGCRNRQAARGLWRPWVNSPWRGPRSSPRRESGKGRRSVGSLDRGGKTTRRVAGSPLTGKTLRKQVLGALVDGRRSAPWMPLLLTRVRRNRRWFFGVPGSFADLGRAGARQRASEVGRQPGTRLITPWPSSTANAVLCSSPRETGRGRHDRSWVRDVNCVST